jgi:hypothetical protein
MTASYFISKKYLTAKLKKVGSSKRAIDSPTVSFGSILCHVDEWLTCMSNCRKNKFGCVGDPSSDCVRLISFDGSAKKWISLLTHHYGTGGGYS